MQHFELQRLVAQDRSLQVGSRLEKLLDTLVERSRWRQQLLLRAHLRRWQVFVVVGHQEALLGQIAGAVAVARRRVRRRRPLWCVLEAALRVGDHRVQLLVDVLQQFDGVLALQRLQAVLVQLSLQSIPNQSL